MKPFLAEHRAKISAGSRKWAATPEGQAFHRRHRVEARRKPRTSIKPPLGPLPPLTTEEQAHLATIEAKVERLKAMDRRRQWRLTKARRQAMARHKEHMRSPEMREHVRRNSLASWRARKAKGQGTVSGTGLDRKEQMEMSIKVRRRREDLEEPDIFGRNIGRNMIGSRDPLDFDWRETLPESEETRRPGPRQGKVLITLRELLGG